MSIAYRKVVRDAVLGILRATWNDTFNDVANDYGIAPFGIDFSGGSQSFAVAHIDPSRIEASQLQIFPAACLYTTDATDNGDPHGFIFSGSVMANLDFYVRNREGIEPSDSESQFDAIEDAALMVLNDPSNQWPDGVIFARNSRMQREYLIPLGDGFATRIPISTLFEVYVT